MPKPLRFPEVVTVRVPRGVKRILALKCPPDLATWLRLVLTRAAKKRGWTP